MKKITFLLVFISIFGYSQTAITDANIQTAVDLWISDSAAATTTYGVISDWDVSQVTDMGGLFNGKTTFNDDISNWNVSSVTNMYRMFRSASSFNQPIGVWNVSNVTDMSSMFDNTIIFNQDIGSWDVSSVGNMQDMFKYASAFNQDLSSWDTAAVIYMGYMFVNASSFNQDIGTWDVSSVTNMGYMLYNTSFNQDISEWCVTNIVSEPNGFSLDSPLSESNKPVWGTCPTLGIDDQNFTNISIYPNPTNNTLFITGNETPITVAIYNVLGKEVLSVKNTNNINVKALPSGVYVIRISDGVGQTNRKFIKN